MTVENCSSSEADCNVVKHGVVLIGETNSTTLVAAEASNPYSRNVLEFSEFVPP